MGEGAGSPCKPEDWDICHEIMSSVYDRDTAYTKLQKYNHLNKSCTVMPVEIPIWMGGGESQKILVFDEELQAINYYWQLRAQIK